MVARHRVLISVFDKAGLLDYGRKLVELDSQIISTGGTADKLRKADIPVTDASEVTGFPEMMEGRLKTIHPKIIGGLIADRASTKHLGELVREGIQLFDALVVNLYPLEAKIATPGATREDIIESIDIGGPNMISAAAKGGVPVIVDPADMPELLSRLAEGTHLDAEYTARLAAKATGHVAHYRTAEARWRSGGDIDGMVGTKALACKYGENAPQAPAALFSTGTGDPLGLDRLHVVAGQPPSYNNLIDVHRLLQTITHAAAAFEKNTGRVPFIAVGVKHGNACGAGIGDDPLTAIQRMAEGDRRALFGGLVMTNFEIHESRAEGLLSYAPPKGMKRQLLDGIIAPAFTSGAIDQLKRGEDKCRFLQLSALDKIGLASLDAAPIFRPVRGGFLRQPNYTYVPDLPESLPSRNDLLLALAVCATSNSNTITLVKNGKVIGNGVGQQDRVSCCELAIKRARDAGHETEGAVAASDSFFPFEDGPEALAGAGIKAIFATSGSKRDEKVRETCERLGVALFQLPDAEARMFFGH